MTALAAGRASPPASAPSPPSAPATRPAVTAAQAAAAAKAAQARLDDSFAVFSTPPFVIAGNMPSDELRKHVQDSIVSPAQALYASYFNARPDKVITVFLFADEKSYRDWARRLFGDANVPYYGYYRHADRTLVMNIATGSGTLVHELTHALIAFDWPTVPLWFNEGFSSLHEQCQVQSDRLVGLPNWRLPALQEAIRRNSLTGLEKLPAGDFYGPDRGMNYAQARYFCQYLQHRGLLRQFYRAYRVAAQNGQTFEQVVQTVCGGNIGQVDQDMRRWVLTLTWR